MPLAKDSKGRSVVPIVIKDSPLPVDENRIFPITSSVSGETIHYFQGTDVPTCTKACETAYEAFQGGWKRATVTARRNLLYKVADLFEQNKDELVRVQKAETSCEQSWAENNVALSVAYIREIAACISSIRGVIPPNDKPDTMAFVYKEPIGPVLIIPP